jgi:hypothetical protein
VPTRNPRCVSVSHAASWKLVCVSSVYKLTVMAVCAINRSINGAGDEEFDEWIAIAGELKEKGGGHMDSKVQRLKTSPSHADSEKEGLSWEINGGFRELEGNEKRKQKAIIELVCDQKRTGLENLYDPKEKYEDAPDGKDGKNKREDSDKTDEDDEKSSSLKYVRWDQDGGDVDILRLEWRTKFACEGAKDDKDQEDAAKGNHWGFFTWFIIMLVSLSFSHHLAMLTCSNSAFLSTATYLIFGSWLNYNRYGARGWDLLPHGDTIRDVPYLFKDWMRRVLNTIQGGGSRGGYAAV